MQLKRLLIFMVILPDNMDGLLNGPEGPGI